MTDRQREAYRRADSLELVTDNDLDRLIERGDLLVPSPDDPIVSPEHWHSEGMFDHEPPKTVEEAKEALRARVEDPTAPDDDVTAYDDAGE